MSTGAAQGVPTDARLSINILGEQGQTGFVQLPRTSAASFSAGSHDEFHLRLPHVGKVTRVHVKSDGSGMQPRWHLDNIVVLPGPPNAPEVDTAQPTTQTQLPLPPQAQQRPASPTGGARDVVSHGLS